MLIGYWQDRAHIVAQPRPFGHAVPWLDGLGSALVVLILIGLGAVLGVAVAALLEVAVRVAGKLRR